MDTASVVRFGNEPRNVDGVRMDHMNNWDLSIAKRNDITERVYLQFTAEFFNAFNHVRFGAPDNKYLFLSTLYSAPIYLAGEPCLARFSLGCDLGSNFSGTARKCAVPLILLATKT